MKDSPDMSIKDLFLAIDGRPVFAWLPTPLHDASGIWRDGWAWCRWVLCKRAIGMPRYFYTEIEE
jgi:hypothetical protein